MPNQDIQTRQMSANQFTNVKDIVGNVLLSKDGYVFAYIRIPSINIDLLPLMEKKAKATNQAASFKDNRSGFAYCSYPREIDLDVYKNDIKNRYRSEMDNRGRQKILQIMLMEATELSTNGENYDHQHFIKIWQKIGNNKTDAEHLVKTRIEEMKVRYESIGVPAEILKDADIVKMCNMYANSLQAPYDVDNTQYVYETITTLK